MLPAAALVIILMVAPIGETVYRSFTNWDGLTSSFIGLTNFRLIFSNPVTTQVLLNSVIFLISVPLILIASVVVAVLVYERVLGWRVFRFLFFIPAVLSPVIVGALFSTFFLPSGLVDKALSPIGLSSYPWLSHPWTARVVVILALVWTSFGFGMVVVLSALSTIDPALYDAAAIDGASWWRRLWSITLPLISGSLQFLSVINVIYTFTSLFSFVYVITAGGPGLRDHDRGLLHLPDHLRERPVRLRRGPGRPAVRHRAPADHRAAATAAQARSAGQLMTTAPHRHLAERRAPGAVAPARSSRWLTGLRARRFVVFIGLCLVGITTVYPLIFMALNSMRSAQAYEVSPYGLPTHYNLDNFRALFDQVPFLASVLHSIIVVVPAVLLATLFSALAAYVFTKVPIKLGNALFWLMLMIMFMPGIVVLIPLYVEIGHLGLASSFAPAILIYTAISIPYGTYLLRSIFRAIPDSVVEAARVDGATGSRSSTG